MDHASIPQRIPALSWRRPTFVWTPLALAAAIGWPVAALQNEGALAPYALVAGAAMFALALTTLGLFWATGRAPKTRREIVSHVVWAGAAAALIGPFVLMQVLALVADYEREGAGAGFTLGMPAAVAPLALMLALPIALISGLVFALIALAPGEARGADDAPTDVQPFR